jgi:hypothetical protein
VVNGGTLQEEENRRLKSSRKITKKMQPDSWVRCIGSSRRKIHVSRRVSHENAKHDVPKCFAWYTSNSGDVTGSLGISGSRELGP